MFIPQTPAGSGEWRSTQLSMCMFDNPRSRIVLVIGYPAVALDGRCFVSPHRWYFRMCYAYDAFHRLSNQWCVCLSHLSTYRPCDLCNLPCPVISKVVREDLLCFPLKIGLYLSRIGRMNAIDTEPPCINHLSGRRIYMCVSTSKWGHCVSAVWT